MSANMDRISENEAAISTNYENLMNNGIEIFENA